MQNSVRSGLAVPSSSTTVRSQSVAQVHELSLALRVGLPLALAALAAGLNVAAVRKQISPIEVYALAVDLPAGAQLTPRDLKLVEVAGQLDRSQLIKPLDLRRSGDGKAELVSLDVGLNKHPRILSRTMVRGELLTKASLGGRTSASNNEELIQVPRSLIRGHGHDLQPGQDVYFLARKRSSADDNQEPFEIGPFRVALQEPGERGDNTNSSQATIPLIYALQPDGTPVPAAKVLRTAVLSENNFTLAVIEKALRKSDTSR